MVCDELQARGFDFLLVRQIFGDPTATFRHCAFDVQRQNAIASGRFGLLDTRNCLGEQLNAVDVALDAPRNRGDAGGDEIGSNRLGIPQPQPLNCRVQGLGKFARRIERRDPERPR